MRSTGPVFSPTMRPHQPDRRLARDVSRFSPISRTVLKFVHTATIRRKAPSAHTRNNHRDSDSPARSLPPANDQIAMAWKIRSTTARESGLCT